VKTQGRGRLLVPLFVLVMAAVARGAAQDALSPGLLALLQEIKAADTEQLSVSEEDGRFLRVMVASSGARR
jgi:hypothetical protein